MSKKTEKDQEKLPRTQLEAGEYWEWRTTIEEVKVAEEKLRVSQLELKILQQNAEIAALRTQVYCQTTLPSAQEKARLAKVELETFRKSLEEKIGMSLSGKMITDSFEVQEVPQENKAH